MNLFTKKKNIKLDREMIKLEDIVISKSFRKSTPNKQKFDEKLKFFSKYKEPKEIIIINQNNVLIDGYTSYLILKEVDAYEVLVKRVCICNK